MHGVTHVIECDIKSSKPWLEAVQPTIQSPPIMTCHVRRSTCFSMYRQTWQTMIGGCRAHTTEPLIHNLLWVTSRTISCMMPRIGSNPLIMFIFYICKLVDLNIKIIFVWRALFSSHFVKNLYHYSLFLVASWRWSTERTTQAQHDTSTF